MNFIDTHAHLNLFHYKEDRDEVISRAKACGVGAIINVGISPVSIKKAINLAHKYEKGVYATVSIHPMYVDRYPDISKSDLLQWAQDERVVALGETGLDFYYYPETEENQEKRLIEIIEIARELDKPIIFHSREANDKFLKVMGKYAADLKSGTLRAVKHCFTEHADFAKEVLDLGMMISVNGLITFAREEQQEAIKSIPLDRLMLETDCPYMMPRPLSPELYPEGFIEKTKTRVARSTGTPGRERRNEPAYILEVAKKIAEIKNVSMEEVAEKTTENAREFFNIELA